ncbi:hypothetical protein P4O66_003794 [Electrophorus voltai]|uniref:Uncharacterized protein n=1 Tax=Electrophorus voltai TaxID=2609070 RepID=A0AAD8ZR08_9TELE|nr:hypothetical protein P4O66_003794 [Electrophorus voltai]
MLTMVMRPAFDICPSVKGGGHWVWVVLGVNTTPAVVAIDIMKQWTRLTEIVLVASCLSVVALNPVRIPFPLFSSMAFHAPVIGMPAVFRERATQGVFGLDQKILRSGTCAPISDIPSSPLPPVHSSSSSSRPSISHCGIHKLSSP